MTRPSASERMRRMLALIPWIIAHGPGGASVSEACSRFGMDRDELTRELERVWMVGLYPYTPDRLIDVLIEGDRVSLRLAEYFSRPLRLTPAEALALIATGRSLTQVPGADPEGPLARGVKKLASAMAIDAERLGVDLGEADEETIEAIRGAIATSHLLEMDYYSYGRDERSTRRVEPRRVFAERGSWYLTANDLGRDGERIFRLDRIESLTVLDERFERSEEPAGAVVFDPGPEVPRVTLELEPGGRWMVEQFPVEESRELPGGRLSLRVAVSGGSWLERLLLRLGPDGRVVQAPAELEGLGPRAARRVLARYR